MEKLVFDKGKKGIWTVCFDYELDKWKRCDLIRYLTVNVELVE